MPTTPRRSVTALRAGAVLLLVLSVLSLWGAATPASASVPAIVDDPGHVTADALPTVQVNGVVWDQEIIGNTVYAVGEFTQARPPGANPGQNQTPRANILAYNLTTGQLIQSFNPSLNRQGKAIEASPDGSRLYVVGSFTQVNNQNRYRIAALDPTTGDLIPGFGAAVDYTVNAVTVTDSAIYVGGAFNFAQGNSRPKLAAFSATNGALLNWAPAADATVHAMETSPDGTRIYAGGQFLNINGQPAYGMVALDADSGATVPWSANQVVRNGGNDGAILFLKATDSAILGGGFTWGRGGGNLEGVFSADPTTGAINWVQDCHGDSYDAAAANDYAYAVHHDHYCGNVGGFPQSENWATNQKRATSFTEDARGTLRREPWSYHNWEGARAPSMVNWFPDLDVGSYTGQNQAAWDVEAHGDYVVMGGEFPRVNNQGQQGLVRFAVRGVAPAAQGPRLSGSAWPVRAQSPAAGVVRVALGANWDRDDSSLSYRIVRNGTTVHTRAVESTFWDRPTIGFDDTGLTPGQTYSYQVRASDADNNVAWSSTLQVTAAGSGTNSAYSTAVMNDGARMHWRFDESSGTTATPALGFENMTRDTGATFGAAGAIPGGDGAVSLNGSSSARLYTSNWLDTSEPLSVEVWFRTNSTNGGRLMGFANRTNATSTNSDRMLYLTNTGRVTFGAWQPRQGSGSPGTSYNTGFDRLTIQSQTGLNNNQWHHAVGTLGDDGMNLYIDGVKVASRGDVLYGRGYYGYWKLGNDTLANWPNRPSTDSFTGDLDEPAVYGAALSPNQVANHYAASGRTPNLPPAPGDAYGAAVRADQPGFYYRLDEASSSTAQDTGLGAQDGTYVNTVTRNQSGAIPGNAAAGFGNGFVRSPQYFGPGTYSAEAWFNTTTSSGGQIIGFGNASTGNSSSVDRQVYMRNDGGLVFEAVAGDGRIQTANSYRDGAWHHVVATQGPSGMALYVDGVPVGTDAQPSTGGFFGYWRVGQDTTPGDASSNAFSGRIDEAAVYSRVLAPAEITEHFRTGGGQVTNLAPVAAFTATANHLQVSFDGRGSTDTDGTVVAHSWDFGDGSTDTDATPSHTYASGGIYPVTLTVTDDDGATGVITQNVQATEPPPNQAPTASFTHAEVGLQVAVDGTGSSDTDGTVASYAWSFGDGTTAAGATATHNYAGGGTYQVTLTVTDDDGAIGSTTTSVTVNAQVVLAADNFERSATNSLGSAPTGGAWTLGGTASNFGVSGGTANVTLPSNGVSRSATLSGVGGTEVDQTLDFSLDKAPGGGGIYVSSVIRKVANSEYRLRAKLLPGATNLQLMRVLSGAEATISAVTIPGIDYAPNSVVHVRVRASGSGSTQLQGKMWIDNSPEPTDWQIQATDTSAQLQGAGGVGFHIYLSASAGIAPAVVRVDNLLTVAL